jgi:DNA polymerase III subunit gamma/tau
MALLRVVHASQLPDPGELARRIQSGEVAVASAPPPPFAAPAPAASAPSSVAPASPAASAPVAPEPPALLLPADFPALITLLDEKGARKLSQQLHDYAGLIAYDPPLLAIRPVKPLPGDFARDLATTLRRLTEATWEVSLRDAPSEPSLLQQEQAAAEAARNDILNAPMVLAARAAFPDAELIEDTRSIS